MRDPRFASFAAKTRAVGAHQKAHPQPGNEVAAAKKAAVPPSNDVAGQAKAAAVGDMTTAQPGVFDKAAFMTAVRAAIAKAVPENAKEADEFNSSGKAGAVKAEVKGQIGQGTQASARDIRGKATATPDPGRAVSVPAKPLADAPQVAPAHDPGAASAMPTTAPPAQTDLSGAPREVNGQMADAGVTEQQLANSNEPQFTDALAAKKEGDAHSATAAAPVLAAQSQAITATKADAASQSAGVMGAIGGAHKTAFGAVGQQKNATKSGDEAAKAHISSQLESIYGATKTETEGILTGLDTTVDSEFESGEKAAKQAFEDYQSDAVSSWKLHRYLLPVGGLIQWGIDQFKPLSPELIKIFADARNLYMQRMDATISRVADIIGRELTRARTRIALGRQQMADFIGTQKGQMAAFAKEAGAGISDKFGELDKSVDEKQEGLVDDLASKYVEARKGIDDRITELQSENKGLWEQAQAAIAGAIETILKLKKMLESVLARAAGAVGKIIDDPMSFLGHLVAGVRAGLDGFVANIGTHLKKGLQEWLFGELASTGIEIPDKFDLKGIFTLVTSILGLTWTNFRTRLVAQIGEPVTAKIEKGFGIVKAIATTGIAGAWKWIVEKIGDLKSTVMDGIKSFVTEKIVMAGIQWLIGLLNPAAAFVKAVKMIYDLIMWFVDNAERIKELVDSVLGSVEEIIAGNVGKVAALIEGSLAKILPIAIGFLAGLAGVSGIGASIKKVVMSVQKPVNKVFDWLIGKAVKFGKGIIKRLKNSKLVKKAKAAAKKAKAWAKKKVAQAKAWGKKKIAGAKKWVKAKVGGAVKWVKKKLGIKDKKPKKNANDGKGPIVAVSVPVGSEQEPHTLLNKPGSNQLVMHSLTEFQMATFPDSAIRKKHDSYVKNRDSTDPKKQSAASVQLADITGLVKAWNEEHAKQITGPIPSSLGRVAPYNNQPSQSGKIPKMRLVMAEHVIPQSLVSFFWRSVGLPRSTTPEYGRMETVMWYRSAEKRKNGGSLGDFGIIAAARSLLKKVEPKPGTLFKVPAGDIESREAAFVSQAESARERTKQAAADDFAHRAQLGSNEPQSPTSDDIDVSFNKQRAQIHGWLVERVNDSPD